MGVVAHDYQIEKKSVDPNSDTLISPICIYSDYTFSQHYIPKHHVSDPIIPATYKWILWESPMARSVWTKAREILGMIGLDLTASSYHEAIWGLAHADAIDGDETEKLRSVTKQNLTIFALWVLYSADKKINELKQTNQLTDEKVDNWVRTVTENFERLVYDEISLLLRYRREMSLTTKINIDGRAGGHTRRSCGGRMKIADITAIGNTYTGAPARVRSGA